MNAIVMDWLAGREMTGSLSRLLHFGFEGIEFYLGAAAFVLLCLSLRMLMRALKQRPTSRKGRLDDGFSLAAEKLRRAYAVFAWGFMSLSFMLSILFYLP